MFSLFPEGHRIACEAAEVGVIRQVVGIIHKTSLHLKMLMSFEELQRCVLAMTRRLLFLAD